MILSPERRSALTAKAQGYAGNIEQAVPYLMSRGITREVAAMFSLGYVPHGQEHGGRLSIPYLTPAGCVQIKYRCMKDEHHAGTKHTADDCPKYIFEAGLGLHLYNAQVLIGAADSVVLTEGELDAICVQAYCGIPAVGYPGVDTWGKESHWRLCFDGVSEVVVVTDGDKQGREAARRIADSIGSHARVADLPDGEDSNSFLAAQGAQAYLARIL